jgi:hypothetical protein
VVHNVVRHLWNKTENQNEITKYFFSKSNNIFVLFSESSKVTDTKKKLRLLLEIDKISLEK